jgi:hypothetical protein
MQGTSGRSHSVLLRVFNNAADGSLRLARRVKINEIKLTIILFIYLVFGFTALILSPCCNLLLFKTSH